MTDTVYTGWLKKGTETGTIVGELTDRWNWRIAIAGTFDEATRQYVLTGTLGEPPAALRVAATDAEPVS